MEFSAWENSYTPSFNLEQEEKAVSSPSRQPNKQGAWASDSCIKPETQEDRRKEPERPTFFIRPGDKQLYQASRDWGENLHKA